MTTIKANYASRTLRRYAKPAYCKACNFGNAAWLHLRVFERLARFARLPTYVSFFLRWSSAWNRQIRQYRLKRNWIFLATTVNRWSTAVSRLFVKSCNSDKLYVSLNRRTNNEIEERTTKRKAKRRFLLPRSDQPNAKREVTSVATVTPRRFAPRWSLRNCCSLRSLFRETIWLPPTGCSKVVARFSPLS